MSRNPFLIRRGTGRSEDGVTWSLSPVNAFCRSVELTNGTVVSLARRERPNLIFDGQGVPTHLVSSAAWGGAAARGDATFTFIQPLGVAPALPVALDD